MRPDTKRRRRRNDGAERFVRVVHFLHAHVSELAIRRILRSTIAETDMWIS